MKKEAKSVLIIFRTYLLSLIIFSLFRVVQFFIHYKEVVNDKDFSFSEVMRTFYYGFKFDLVSISYLLILPFILLLINDFIKKKLLQRIVFEFVYLLFSLSFLIAMADIPYYNKFYSRITVASLEWFNEPITVISMIFQDIKLGILFIPLFFILWLVRKWLSKIFYLTINNVEAKKRIPLYILTTVLIFLGLRGTITGAPLRYRDAFNDKNMFLNTLKLNPVYTMGKSYEEKLKNNENKLNLINEDIAIKNVRSYFSVPDDKYESPIARKVNFQSNVIAKKNVVMIIMEGLGASKMKYFGSKEDRTPFLDSLFLKGKSFTNLYSNGIHTYGGVFGTNYSYPMVFSKHPMTEVVPRKYNGLPYTLSKNGYHNSFFIAGNGSFDNMSTFLYNNSYHKVYTRADYPKKEYLNTYGVSDDYLLSFALKKINNRQNKKQPFLATILTISDHSPFRVPDYYKPKTENKSIRGTQFADWSMERFMKKASKEPWYENTIFVFISDHGMVQGINYKTPLTYNHIPLIYYYKGVKHQIVDKMASQLDVFPTLMNLLKLNYINNSFGIDLFDENRPYAIFNHDEEYGVIDKNFLLIVNKNETIGLYKYQKKDKNNYKSEYPEVVKKMENYFKSQIQTYQYMLKNNLQFVKE